MHVNVWNNSNIMFCTTMTIVGPTCRFTSLFLRLSHQQIQDVWLSPTPLFYQSIPTIS